MEIRTLRPHEYAKAEPGMEVMIDILMTDDPDLEEYFMERDGETFFVESFDNENDIIWLQDCEFAIDPEMAIKI